MDRIKGMKWTAILLLALMLAACTAADKEPALETTAPEPEDTPEGVVTPIDVNQPKEQELVETATSEPDQPRETPEQVLELATPVATKPVPVTEGYPAPDIPIEPPTDDPAVQKFVTIAKEDLAQRLAIPIEAITLIAFEYITWPDASMGCPRPDMMYAQVLVDGYRIILQADAKRYNYHGGGSPEDAPFLCDNVNFKDIGYPPPRLDDK